MLNQIKTISQYLRFKEPIDKRFNDPSIRGDRRELIQYLKNKEDIELKYD